MSNEDIPENSNSPEEESNSKLISNIARRYYLNEITDDNESPSNQLTGLDQVIVFGFNLDPDNVEDMENLRNIKLEILNKIDCEYKGGSNFPLEEINELDVKYSVEDEQYNSLLLNHFIYRHAGEKAYKIWTKELAMGVVRGILTDDNPSELNNATGLEQAILLGIKSDPKDSNTYWELLSLIKLNVISRVSEFNGGHNFIKDDSDVLEHAPLWFRY